MKKICVLLLLGVLLTSGCTREQAADTASTTQQVERATTTLPHASTTASSAGKTTTTLPKPNVADVDSVVEANNAFALDLYRMMKTGGGNIFFSPWSISTALTMTYEGARGETADEMRTVLHLPEDIYSVRGSYKAIQAEINREGKSYELNTANAIWPQKDFQFLPEYVEAIREYYGGEVTPLDYRAKTEESRVTINTWVEEKTREKIKDLIPKGVLGADTRLVLTNAIYFKGKWLGEFDKNLTRQADFTTGSGGKVKVDMMVKPEGETRHNYYESSSLQMIELPYKDDELSMLVILPTTDMDDVEDSLSAENLRDWKGGLRLESVIIHLPKFKLEEKYFMAGTLQALGMRSAFQAADFSGMDGKRDLAISEVIHQSYVKVDEEGTEAAAATAVVMKVTAVMPTQPKVFNADHPFIFIIQDKKTANILFMGKVDNPGA